MMAARKPLTTSLAAAGALALFELLRSRFQHRNLFRPERETELEPGRDAPVEEWIPVPGGGRLHAWWRAHPYAQGTLLFCHGNSGQLASMKPAIRWLSHLRCHVLAFDYRGYGLSEGRPSEASVFEDARIVFDWLVESKGLAPEGIVLYGHSLGGAIAIDLATDRKPGGLIVQSSFTDVLEMARVRFPMIPAPLIARNQFRSLDKVGSLEGLPKLFLHGDADETIPMELGQRLFEAAAEPKRWVEIPGGGHSDLHLRGRLQMLWALRRFLAEALQPAN